MRKLTEVNAFIFEDDAGFEGRMMLKDVTPQYLRCIVGQCPSVYEGEGGSLVVIGKKLSKEVQTEIQNKIGDDEFAVVIDREYFKDIDFSSNSPSS